MMKIHIALIVALGLCIVLVAAKPGGGRGGGKGKNRKPGHENPPPMTPDEGATGGMEGPGRKPSKGGRNPGRGRPQHTDVTDPACAVLECEKPTRETVICGTDGETYRSECLLLRDRCKGKIAADVEVASQGRCQHPAEAGEPKGHRGPGRRTKPGRRPSGKPNGKHPKGGRRPSKGRWPEECWGLMTTIAPTTDIDYVTDAEEEGPECTASCPASTPEIPLQAVCATNGKTYESACVLELVACITNDLELMVSTEGACQ